MSTFQMIVLLSPKKFLNDSASKAGSVNPRSREPDGSYIACRKDL